MTDDAKLLKALKALNTNQRLCLIYETLQEQNAVVVPFIFSGLERGEKCILVVDDHSVESILESLHLAGIDVNKMLDTGALTLMTRQEIYLRDGVFHPDQPLNFVVEFSNTAKNEGFNGLRVVGEMTWALSDIHLLDYNNRLNALMGEHDVLALCQYHRQHFNPATLLDVLRSSSRVIVDGVLAFNPYYIPPDETSYPQQVERWLGNIRTMAQTEQSLRENELKFRRLFEVTPDAVLVVNSEGHIILFNPQAAGIFGYSADEITGKVVETLVPLPLRTKHADYRSDYMAHPKMRSMAHNREISGLRKDGSEFPAEVGLSPLETDDTSMVVSIVKDITERKEAEKQALELAIAREKTRLLTEFIDSVAHDFRTPLTSISLNVFLLRSAQDAAAIAKRTNMIEQQTTRITTLLNSFMTMVRLDGIEELTFQPTPIKPVIESVISQFKIDIAKKALNVMTSVTDTSIHASPPDLKQAIMELVKNAVQFTPENAAIIIEAYKNASHLVIEVFDTGIGIARDELPHIFERLYRSNRARVSDGGTGLGLSIAKRIAELHHGSLQATSIPGAGSLFRMTLPIS